MPIRTVFFGSPTFAVPSLSALAHDPRFAVTLVVTQPDRPAGRGRRLQPPPVKQEAERLGLPVWQPETLRSEDAVERLAAERADLFVVVAYGEILTRRVLALPAHGCLNVHPSLLPRYRGSSPIQAAILNGDSETGVTIMLMVRRLDAGPIVAQRAVQLSGQETAGDLGERLARVAADMLPDIASRWVSGEIKAQPQDESCATYTRELRKEDGRIDWRRSAVEIERLVRAMNPWPGAWTRLEGRRLGVRAVDISNEHHPPATIHQADHAVLVGTGTTAVRLLTVQPEGRGPMPAADWYNGARLAPGARFEIPESEGS